MIYMPIEMLEPGMVLARNIPSSNPILPLMVAGQTLTQEAIARMVNRGIKGLYVEFEGTEDLELEEALEPEQKQIILAEIKTEFCKIQQQHAELNYHSISNMAECIVLGVLERERMLTSVLDIRDYDSYTYSHSMYVGMIAVMMGAQLKLPSTQLTDLAAAGLMHDIGKLDISSQIINKPTALTKEEFEMIKEHPARAVERLKRQPGCKDVVLQGVATHHEHFDGNGYPHGLSKKRIPLFGRILAIADVYDALSSNRSYRKAWNPAQVIDYLTSRSGTQFDPDLLNALVRSVAAYPVGSLVQLSDSSMGLVIQNHPEFTLRPTVRLLSPPERAGEELDLSAGHFHITVLDFANEAGLLSAPPKSD